MPSGYTVDQDAVRRVTPKFTGPADKLDDARKALDAALQSAGECWGNDEAGQAFAKDYLPCVPDTTKFFTELAKAVRDLQKSVNTAMDGYDQSDENASKSVPGQELT